MSKIKPNTLDFECSYCGYSWNANQKDFKMSESKIGKKVWARFFMPCPSCRREVSVVKEILSKGDV